MNHYDKLWVEKWRPTKIDEIVLTDDVRTHLERLSTDIPHLLFHGRAGIGKTTTAKVLIKAVLGCQSLYINASDESGIDAIRTKVMTFAQTRSFDGQRKVILLDECDGMSPTAMRGLRSVMEEYNETTRFILTANQFSKIIEPIRSRCIIFNLKPDLKGCIQRCIKILKEENIDIGDNLPELINFVKDRFPDMRRTINDLQMSSVTGKLVLVKGDIADNFTKILWTQLKTCDSVLKLRKCIIQGESEFNSDYQNLYKSLFNIIYDDPIADAKKKELLLELGEFTYRDNFVIDHEINFYCFLISAEKILK